MKIFGSISKLVSVIFSTSGGNVTLTQETLTGADRSVTIPNPNEVVAGDKEIVLTAGSASTDNSVPRFDSTSGSLLQTSGVVIDDTNNITGVTSVTVGNTGLVVGASTPFSDSSGTLTLQNVDALDSTTEATIEAAIDTLANLTSIQSQTVTLSAGLTVEATSTINQDLTTDASPTFAAVRFDTPADGDYVQVQAPDTTGNQTITLPAVTGTLATLAGTEELTNKKLTGGTADANHKWLPPTETTTNLNALASRTEGEIAFDSTTKQLKTYNGSAWVAGSGDVAGPASSVDNAIVRFDGTGGKTIQGYTSGAPTISDTGVVTFAVAPLVDTIDEKTTNNGVQIKGSTSGSSIAVGYVGEAVGADRSGTNGKSISTRSTTAPTSSATSVISATLNKGVYQASFIGYCYQADGSDKVSVTYAAVGGTAVTTSFKQILTNNKETTLHIPSFPVVITADSTALAIYVQVVGLSGSVSEPNWELFITRMA